MQLTIHQIDAFTNELFKGNYAAVIPLDTWLSDDLMLKIGAENNVSETAFTCRQTDGSFAIRWFSPLMEIDFCGHATLAAAFVLCEQHNLSQVRFQAAAVGELVINKNSDGSFAMTFPKQAPFVTTEIPSELFAGLSIQPVKVLKNKQAYFAIYEKDRTGKLAGQTFANPSFKTIECILPLLNGESQAQSENPIDIAAKDSELIEKAEVEREKKSAELLEACQDLINGSKTLVALAEVGDQIKTKKRYMTNDDTSELRTSYKVKEKKLAA